MPLTLLPIATSTCKRKQGVTWCNKSFKSFFSKLILRNTVYTDSAARGSAGWGWEDHSIDS